MPVQLASIPITRTSTSGTVSLAAMQVSALPRSASGPFAHLELINETGTGLVFTFPTATNQQWPVPAGKHRVIPIPPGESQVNWKVLNSYPTAFTQQCFVFYFEFNETPTDLGQIGAAQIGNQPRIITLGPAILNGLHSVSPPPSNIPAGGDALTGATFNFTSDNINNGIAYSYLYWFKLTASNNANGVANYTFYTDTLLPDGVTVVSTFFLNDVYGAFLANTTFYYTLEIGATPNAIPVIISGGATKFRYRIHNNDGGVSPNVWWNIGIAIGSHIAAVPGTHDFFALSAGPW